MMLLPRYGRIGGRVGVGLGLGETVYDSSTDSWVDTSTPTVYASPDPVPYYVAPVNTTLDPISTYTGGATPTVTSVSVDTGGELYTFSDGSKQYIPTPADIPSGKTLVSMVPDGKGGATYTYSDGSTSHTAGATVQTKAQSDAATYGTGIIGAVSKFFSSFGTSTSTPAGVAMKTGAPGTVPVSLVSGVSNTTLILGAVGLLAFAMIAGSRK